MIRHGVGIRSERGKTLTAKHIAWFRFREGVGEDRIEHHLTAVRSLVDLVPEVLSIECGASYTDRAGGLTHCIVVTLPNREALPRYLDHPAHVPIAGALVADVAELRVMDLDLGPMTQRLPGSFQEPKAAAEFTS